MSPQGINAESLITRIKARWILRRKIPATSQVPLSKSDHRARRCCTQCARFARSVKGKRYQRRESSALGAPVCHNSIVYQIEKSLRKSGEQRAGPEESTEAASKPGKPEEETKSRLERESTLYESFESKHPRNLITCMSRTVLCRLTALPIYHDSIPERSLIHRGKETNP
jgi:hypothetical protein